MIGLATAFSGIGAPEQGMKDRGIKYRVVFAVEWDKWARETYSANWDTQAFYEDVTKTRFMKHRGKVHVFVAGPPCQAFSTAGARGGLDDPRGKMLFEFIRILEEVRPNIFVFENVRGLLSMDEGRVWTLLVGMMNRAGGTGYDVFHKVLNTADYGLPQHRERVFAVGFRRGKKKITGLVSPFEFPRKFPLKLVLGDLLEDYVDGRYALTDAGRRGYLTPPDDRPNSNPLLNIDRDIAHTITTTKDSGRRGVTLVTGRLVDKKFVLGDKRSRKTFARLEENAGKDGFFYTANPEVARTLCAESEANFVSDPRGLVDEKYLISETRKKEITPKMVPNHPRHGFYYEADAKIAKTLVVADDRDLVTDPRGTGLRRLTPLECFRLQGFPDDFKRPVSNSQLYKQAGNSMSTNVVGRVVEAALLYRGMIVNNQTNS